MEDRRPVQAAECVPMNRKGQKLGPARGNATRFPYEPQLIDGRLFMPADLQRIHRVLLDHPVIETMSDETRAVVEVVWPELAHKLPPKRLA